MARTLRKQVRPHVRRPAADGRPGRGRAADPLSADVALDPTLDFLRLIWALDHGLQVSSKRMANRIGVTGPQRLVVRLVGRHPGISAGELAKVLHVHKSTISGIIHRLEARRLVARVADVEDARRARLSLTPGGRRLAGSMPQTVEAAVKRALASVPPPDVTSARRVLDALARELTQAPR